MRTDPGGLAHSCFRGEFTGTGFLLFPFSLADRLPVLVCARGGFWEKKPERWRPELPNQNRKRKVTDPNLPDLGRKGAALPKHTRNAEH